MQGYNNIIMEQLYSKSRFVIFKLLPSIMTTNEVMTLPIILNESGRII